MSILLKVTFASTLVISTGSLGLTEVDSKAVRRTNATQAPDFVLIPIPILAPWPFISANKETSTTTAVPTQKAPAGPKRRPRKCEDVRNKFDCLRAKILFGFNCPAWGGEHCIPELGAKCSDFTDPMKCTNSKRRGLFCIGWTGVSCIR